jgi:hypothetical protein
VNKLNEVSSEIIRTQDEFFMKYNRETKLAVYMTCDYFMEFTAELPRTGAVAPHAFEFLRHGTILGYPVFRVDAMRAKHPPFRVVILEGLV